MTTVQLNVPIACTTLHSADGPCGGVMGRRESQQGCRRMVAPSVGGSRREAGLVLRAAPAGRYQWVAVWVADARGPASGWCLLLRRMGLVGSSAFRCACTCVRALTAARARRGAADCAVPAAGGALREDLMHVAA
jgi:hypothetical protein